LLANLCTFEEFEVAPLHHRCAFDDGHQLFYREAGPLDSPAVVLLHGRPGSSFMFRDLVPIIAERYRKIAPGHLRFGLSDAPTADDFQRSTCLPADRRDAVFEVVNCLPPIDRVFLSWMQAP
jgi:pimeloyl-ACP methyl ester carboxylesterase